MNFDSFIRYALIFGGFIWWILSVYTSGNYWFYILIIPLAIFSSIRAGVGCTIFAMMSILFGVAFGTAPTISYTDAFSFFLALPVFIFQLTFAYPTASSAVTVCMGALWPEGWDSDSNLVTTPVAAPITTQPFNEVSLADIAQYTQFGTVPVDQPTDINWNPLPYITTPPTDTDVIEPEPQTYPEEPKRRKFRL